MAASEFKGLSVEYRGGVQDPLFKGISVKYRTASSTRFMGLAVEYRTVETPKARIGARRRYNP